MKKTGMKNLDERFAFTVGELMEILKGFPSDMPVVTSGYEGGYENIYHPEIRIVKHEPENRYYLGEFQFAKDSDKETIEVLALERVVRHD